MQGRPNILARLRLVSSSLGLLHLTWGVFFIWLWVKIQIVPPVNLPIPVSPLVERKTQRDPGQSILGAPNSFWRMPAGEGFKSKTQGASILLSMFICCLLEDNHRTETSL